MLLLKKLKRVDAGASVWHAYNGMRGLTHREPWYGYAMYELGPILQQS